MHLRHAYLLTFASLLFGVGLSIVEQNWQWFSRSGSLIVVVGILLTSSQIIDELHEMRHRRWRNENHKSSWSKHDWAAEAENHKKQHLGEEETIGRSQGLYLLILGTLIWGYGDVIERLF